MRKFDQLNEQEQAKAIEKATDALLSAIIEGSVRFNDCANGDDLQSRIDAAFVKAENMQTPWFAGEYIMETCAEEIDGMARCDAEDAIYLDDGENVVRL